MTLAVRVLIGLAGGLAVGQALAVSRMPFASHAITAAATLGTIFVNLIRMTAIPLVASILVASLGRMTGTDGLGKLAGRALVLAAGLVVAAAVSSALIATVVFSRVPQPQNAAALGSAGSGAPQTTDGNASFAQWIVDLVPQNVVKAAADGNVLPVIVFAVLFGLALARVSASSRTTIVSVAEGIAVTMQRLVGWILHIAPVGVFALAVPLAARLSLSAAGAVMTYIVLVVILTVIAMGVMLYPLGIVAGRMSARAFVAHCAPGQAIGFASRSSLAALPAMIESAERSGLGSTSSRVMLPLLTSLFHFGAAIQQTVAVLFLASLSGVSLSPWLMASVVVAVVFATCAVPSIPGGSIIALVPVLGVAGLPADGIGILLAIDTIPDMFRTTANLTGAMTLAAVLDPPRAPRR